MYPIQLFDPASSSCSYLLFDETSREALIIDPLDRQIERDRALLRRYGLRLVWTLRTHVHADAGARAALQAGCAGVQAAVPEGCGLAAEVLLKHGDTLQFGREQLLALHTPGHTATSMSFLWRDHVFTGDALLVNGCGRADGPSGNGEALFHSLTQVLLSLPEATTVWPGHDYHGRRHSTIGSEKAGNAWVAGQSLAGFMARLGARPQPGAPRLTEVGADSVTARHDAEGALVMAVRPAPGYAGDVSPQLACHWWQSGAAVLVDVRTDAERVWVGQVPGAIFLAWKQWPGMVMNPHFDEGLQAAVPAGKKVVLLCRSGLRSVAAARRATELGLEAYNILEGFEGDPDEHAQRGHLGGWRFHGLPWRQG